MILKKFKLTPNDTQGHGLDEANEKLKGATHVETYTVLEERWGNSKTLVVFAFYPDELTTK